MHKIWVSRWALHITELHQFVSVIKPCSTTILAHSQAPIIKLLKPMNLPMVHSFLHESGHDPVCKQFQIDGNGKWLTTAYKNGTLVSCHNGSCMPDMMTLIALKLWYSLSSNWSHGHGSGLWEDITTYSIKLQGCTYWRSNCNTHSLGNLFTGTTKE